MQKDVAHQQGSRIFPFARAPAPEVKKLHCPGPGRGSPSQPQGPRAKPTQTPLKPVGGTQPWTPFTPPPRWVWWRRCKKKIMIIKNDHCHDWISRTTRQPRKRPSTPKPKGCHMITKFIKTHTAENMNFSFVAICTLFTVNKHILLCIVCKKCQRVSTHSTQIAFNGQMQFFLWTLLQGNYYKVWYHSVMLQRFLCYLHLFVCLYLGFDDEK